jgi:hypothetical protein
MYKQQKEPKGRTSRMTGLFRRITLTFALTAIFAAQAFAYGLLVDDTQYVYMNSPYGEPTYQVVRHAMEEVYKGHEVVDPIPVIAIAETDLNGDNLPEFIGMPLESDMQIGDYCKKDGLCPHYVVEIRNKETKTIGIIPGIYVSRGEEIENGYFTLRAYTKGEADPKYFETYVFDKKKDSYTLKPSP